MLVLIVILEGVDMSKLFMIIIYFDDAIEVGLTDFLLLIPLILSLPIFC